VWLNHFSEQQVFLLNLEEMGNGGDYLSNEIIYFKFNLVDVFLKSA